MCYYTIMWDRFYYSNDIVLINEDDITDTKGIENLLERQKQLEIDGKFSEVFSCNFYQNYDSFRLEKTERGSYYLVLKFIEDDGTEENRIFELVKTRVYK